MLFFNSCLSFSSATSEATTSFLNSLPSQTDNRFPEQVGNIENIYLKYDEKLYF